MLLLSTQQRKRKLRSTTTNVSSSPSFWIAQAFGALLLCPPDSIERWLPMMAPLPKSIYESRRRAVVDQILDECWGNTGNTLDSSSRNRNSAYEIHFTDEWIVDNQRAIHNNGKKEAKTQQIQEQELSRMKSRPNQYTADSKSSLSRSKSDSLFSNYFLSIHLLFSFPTFGDEDEDDDGIVVTPSNDFSPGIKRAGLSSSTMKPSTYGEITPLGTRQLFGAMGLLDTNRNTRDAIPSYHFVDLGSGAGKLIGQTVLELSGTTVERATGVELSPSRHQSAISAKQALMKKLEQTKTEDKNDNESSLDVSEIDAKFELIEGDLFDVDLSTATHIYVASLCFPDTLMLRLEERLSDRIARQQLQQPTEPVANLQWIATLRPFPNDLGGIRPIIRFMEMSWTSPLGSAVYLYRCDPAQT